MIVCHCNCIQSACIERCTREQSAQGECGRPTPAQVYRSLGKRPCCGGCLPLAASIIAAIHAEGVARSAGACTETPHVAAE